MRYCKDCGKDISCRDYRARWCIDCVKKRAAEKCREWNKELKRRRPKRFCSCGADITVERTDFTLCASCRKERRKNKQRENARYYYQKYRGYKNPPGQPRYCIGCKTDITGSNYNCKRCQPCQKKYRHLKSIESNKKQYEYHAKYRHEHREDYKKYYRRYYSENRNKLLDAKQREWRKYVEVENVRRKADGLPLLGMGYVREKEMKAYLDKLLPPAKHYDNKFWVCEGGKLINRGNDKGGLQLDRYYPELVVECNGKSCNGMAFEYDGEQHSKHFEYFHKTKEDFDRYVEHDRLTNEMCKKAGILLIRVPYSMELSQESLKQLLPKVLR